MAFIATLASFVTVFLVVGFTILLLKEMISDLFKSN
jgi:hypothetical protein